MFINDDEKWSRKKNILANLPGQFSLSGQIFLHWAAATLKGLVEFQNKNSRPLFTIIFNSKILVSRSEILVYLFWEFYLGGVVYLQKLDQKNVCQTGPAEGGCIYLPQILADQLVTLLQLERGRLYPPHYCLLPHPNFQTFHRSCERESLCDFFMKLSTPPSLEFEAKFEGGGRSKVI